MAGEQCLSKDVVVGKEGPMKGCSAERKAEELAAGCLKGEKPADAVAAAGGDGEEPPVEGKRLTELPMDEVLWILAQEPGCMKLDDEETLLEFYPREMVDRIREPLRQGVEASASLRESFLAFQDWVNKELEENGVVKVDDEFLAGREQVTQWVREMYEKIFDRMEELFSDSDYGNYSDMYPTDDDEDDKEEEEVALESTSNLDDEGF